MKRSLKLDEGKKSKCYQDRSTFLFAARLPNGNASCLILDQLYFFRDLRSWLFNFLSWVFLHNCWTTVEWSGAANSNHRVPNLLRSCNRLKKFGDRSFSPTNSTGFSNFESSDTLTNFDHFKAITLIPA